MPNSRSPAAPRRALAWFLSADAVRLALALWGVAALVIAAALVWRPGVRSIYFIFPGAAFDWWAGRPLYSPAIDFFQYLPQSAILHTPFALLGDPAGGILWRWIGMALLLGALWRLAALIAPSRPPKLFALMALLVLLASLGSARNGQPNLQVAALMLHAALDLGARRWGRSAAILVLALAVKPVALVLVLLVAALCPPMRWRLGAGIAIAAAVPFLTQDPSYVVEQYGAAFAKMLRSAQPDRNDFTDINGVYWTLAGEAMNRGVLLAIQLAAALGTLALAWLGLRRRPAADAALVVWTLACCYLMLFNPRNEGNAFVIVAPAVAAVAALGIGHDAARRAEGWIGTAIAVASGMTGLTHPIHAAVSPWLKPTLAAVFAAMVVRRLLRGEAVLVAGGAADQADRAMPVAMGSVARI